MTILKTAVTEAQKAAKAVFAVVTVLLQGIILVTLEPGNSLTTISFNQWMVILLAVIIAGGGVYGLSNKPT